MTMLLTSFKQYAPIRTVVRIVPATTEQGRRYGYQANGVSLNSRGIFSAGLDRAPPSKGLMVRVVNGYPPQKYEDIPKNNS